MVKTAKKREIKVEKDDTLAEIRRKYGFLGGRPVKFNKPEEMLAKIEEFLVWAENRVIEKITKNGVVKANIPNPVTLEAFCNYAGISKTTFYNYGKKKGFKYLVDGYTAAVEEYWVRQCAEGIAGNKADFILKNSFSKNWQEHNDGTLTLKQALVKFIDDGKSGDTDSSDIQAAVDGEETL
jgi:hypothetical protein